MSGIYPNQLSSYPPTDYLTEISLGNIPGKSVVSIIGANEAIGTGSEVTLWEESTTYAFPASASTMTVSSSSANDTSAGSGARSILIEGLDANYAVISEVVTLNGQSGVTTTNSFFRINFMTVLSSGAGLENDGIIFIGTGTITTGKPANAFGRVSAGEGISHTAVYTTPADSQFLLVRGQISSEGAKDITVFFDARPSSVGGTLIRGVTYEVVGQNVPLTFLPSEPYGEKTDIILNVIASGGGGAGGCYANIAGILIT